MSILRDHLNRLRSASTTAPAPVAKPVTAPVAATTKSRPKLPCCGAHLPEVALTVVDVPRDAKVVSGTLLHDANRKTGRPLVMICVPCTCPESDHCYPWRSDWLVNASVRSHQRTRCRKHKAPHEVWLAIDPGRVGRSLQVVREMREALTAWKAQRTSKRAFVASVSITQKSVVVRVVNGGNG